MSHVCEGLQHLVVLFFEKKRDNGTRAWWIIRCRSELAIVQESFETFVNVDRIIGAVI